MWHSFRFMPKASSFFSFYGAKTLRALHYPKPQHSTIIEPFAGAAGYATRYRDRNVILSDVDEVIVGLWDYLIHAKGSEIKSLPAVVRHIDDHPKLTQEQKWLIGFWLHKGVTYPRTKPSAWAIINKSKGSYWGETVRDRLSTQVEEIRHWRVSHHGYEETPPYIGTYFVDPPYQGHVGSYYKHKFDGHGELASWCQSRRGQVIVCEHQGADWLPFQPLGPTGPRNAREVYWHKPDVMLSTGRPRAAELVRGRTSCTCAG